MILIMPKISYHKILNIGILFFSTSF
uniref:Uncharacterized protein n=1 Tax=Rhizophora mucronata TaxID=61149 RepID=A0A2P2R4Z0_RHIMU